MRFAILVPALLAMSISSAWADQSSALADIKAQNYAVDAQIDTSGNAYVLVKPAGLNWPAYAAAMCQLVAPHQARIFRMRIIDLTKANYSKPPATWPRLTEAACAQ